MNFPIQIAFKILALAPQMYVTDGAGQSQGYVKQKLFKLKESVTVFTDETQATPLYHINADRIIDFNAEYTITDAANHPLGSVKRHGARSLWRAHYEINMGGVPVLEVTEESALVRFLDNLIGEIPIIGFFTGYFLNPIYLIKRSDGADVLRMSKKRSFLESLFTITQTGPITGDEQRTALIGLMMIILLERSRG